MKINNQINGFSNSYSNSKNHSTNSQKNVSFGLNGKEAVDILTRAAKDALVFEESSETTEIASAITLLKKELVRKGTGEKEADNLLVTAFTLLLDSPIVNQTKKILAKTFQGKLGA